MANDLNNPETNYYRATGMFCDAICKDESRSKEERNAAGVVLVTIAYLFREGRLPVTPEVFRDEIGRYAMSMIAPIIEKMVKKEEVK